jgi:hypothetical protein
LKIKSCESLWKFYIRQFCGSFQRITKYVQLYVKVITVGFFLSILVLGHTFLKLYREAIKKNLHFFPIFNQISKKLAHWSVIRVRSAFVQAAWCSSNFGYHIFTQIGSSVYDNMHVPAHKTLYCLNTELWWRTSFAPHALFLVTLMTVCTVRHTRLYNYSYSYSSVDTATFASPSKENAFEDLTKFVTNWHLSALSFTSAAN